MAVDYDCYVYRGLVQMVGLIIILAYILFGFVVSAIHISNNKENYKYYENFDLGMMFCLLAIIWPIVVISFFAKFIGKFVRKHLLKE